MWLDIEIYQMLQAGYQYDNIDLEADRRFATQAASLSPAMNYRTKILANQLKFALTDRLKSMSPHGYCCDCGECEISGDKIYSVIFPETYANRVGCWSEWLCRGAFQSTHAIDAGLPFSAPLSAYFPRSELYVLFRETFNGLDIVLDHPWAEYRQLQDLASGKSTTSVELSEQSPLYIRPRNGAGKSVWLNAEIRIDCRQDDFIHSKKPLIVCNINPFAFGQKRGQTFYEYQEIAPMSIYLRLPLDIGCKPFFVPIAKVTEVDPQGRYCVISLDETVEMFNP